jgi:hypothetical protein
MPPKKTIRRRKRLGFSVPCPECQSVSRVIRTTLGERSPRPTSRRPRNYVVRERRCAHGHRFTTEEKAR